MGDMAEKIAVLCRACSHPYSAREVDGEVVLSTDEGRCTCGSTTFVKVESGADDAEAVKIAEANDRVG